MQLQSFSHIRDHQLNLISSKLSVLLLVTATLLTGCANSPDVTRAEKRVDVLTMSVDVLQQLYDKNPELKAQVKQAAGYGVFNNANVNFIVASVGSGYGVVIDNQTKKRTFMKMAEAGVGFGAGVKDFSLVMIFNNQSALDRFIDQGWAFGAQADATAKAGDQGAAAGGEVSVDDVAIYQITQSGIALQLTVKGTKFWKDDELN